VFKQTGLIFWFHSDDVQVKDRPSMHVVKGAELDAIDAPLRAE